MEIERLHLRDTSVWVRAEAMTALDRIRSAEDLKLGACFAAAGVALLAINQQVGLFVGC